MGRLSLQLDDARHKKLKVRSFDYKISMNDYLTELVDLSFLFSDEEFFKFFKKDGENAYKELFNKSCLIDALKNIDIDSDKINSIVNEVEKLMNQREG